MSSHADLQPHQVQVGEGPQREVRLRGHLCEGVSGASPQGQRSLCQSLSREEKGENNQYFYANNQYFHANNQCFYAINQYFPANNQYFHANNQHFFANNQYSV